MTHTPLTIVRLSESGEEIIFHLSGHVDPSTGNRNGDDPIAVGRGCAVLTNGGVVAASEAEVGQDMLAYGCDEWDRAVTEPTVAELAV